MKKDKSFKNADYPNRIPFYAKHPEPQYRAYNKLDTSMSNKFNKGTKDKEHIKGVIKGLRRSGLEVIRVEDIFGNTEVYFRKKRKLKGGLK